MLSALARGLRGGLAPSTALRAASAARGGALAGACAPAPAALLAAATRSVISVPASRRAVLSVTPGTLPVADIKTYKPVTPSLRHRRVVDKSHLWPGRPIKHLTSRIAGHGQAGRNHTGQITVRGRKAPLHRRFYRHVDFHRRRTDPCVIVRFEYDPNRSAFIALVQYESDGELSYILAAEGAPVGATLRSGPEAPIAPGNALPLSLIPDGLELHNIELHAGRGGAMVRSAGNAAKLISKDERHALLKLPSGEIRKVPKRCMATIGAVCNEQWRNRQLGKAGASFWIGRRPKVRGVAMNPRDHPMGGGNGKSSGGRPSSSPWGWYTKGIRTRRKGQPSSKLIVKRRNADKLNLSVHGAGKSW